MPLSGTHTSTMAQQSPFHALLFCEILTKISGGKKRKVFGSVPLFRSAPEVNGGLFWAETHS